MSEHDPIDTLLAMAHRESLSEWLDLPESFAAVEGLAAVGRKLRWAQGQLNNPRYGDLAREVLRHKALLRETIESQAASTSALAPPPPRTPAPPPELDNDEAIRAYWEGLKLAGTPDRGDLQTEERWKKMSGHAQAVGVPQDRLRKLIGDPKAMQDLAEAISLIRGDARVPPAELERALSEASTAAEALERLSKLQGPSRRLDQAHRRELLDGLRGLLLQDALTNSTKEALTRTAGRRGLSPVRARKLLQATVNAWYGYRMGELNPHRHLGVASTTDRERVRKAYRRLRDGLLAQELSWERMEHIARVDAAWSVVSTLRR